MPPSLQTIKHKELAAAGKRCADDVAEGFVVNGDGNYLEELESFNNLVPIMDAVMVDIDNTDQVGEFVKSVSQE